MTSSLARLMFGTASPFLMDYLSYTAEASTRIYGRETQINLSQGQFYFRVGADSFNQDTWMMKSGILVGVDCLQKAQALAHNMTKHFRHPRLGTILFTAKPVPTNLPVHHEQLEFSEAGLSEAAWRVNLDFPFQNFRDLVRWSVLGIGLKDSKSFSLILYAKTVDSAKPEEVRGVTLDVILFRDE